MSPLKKAVLAALAAVVLTSAWQYHGGQARSREAAHLRAENDRMRLQASQRNEARLQQARETAAVNGIPATASASKSDGGIASSGAATDALRQQPSRASAYRDEGQGTAVSALQTFAWACSRADAILLEKLLMFDPAAKPKAEAFFFALPAEVRGQWASAEAMAAAVYVSNGLNRPYPVAEIIAQAKVEQLTSTRVVIHLPGASMGDGYEFQRTADGWKLAITESVVDDYIKNAQQPRRDGP